MNDDATMLGSLVYSRQGRDMGKPFLVVGQINERYVLIADGDLRHLDNPKLKNLRHLSLSRVKSEELIQALARGEPLENHRLRKLVRELAVVDQEVREGGSDIG
ncbi:MAG: hypothetical protein ACM3O9_06915 [Methylocystaceae bacterium]